jgi:hypothetical protein
MKNPEFRSLSLVRKTARRITCWLLCGGLLCSISTLSQAAQSGQTDPTPAAKTCSKQLTASDKRYLGKEIQTQLADFYRNNSDFQAQLKRGGRLLNDGVVGPTTRYWLDYFCNEFSFAAPESENDPHQVFVESLMIALNRAAERNTLYPTWRTAITPPELLTFTTEEIKIKLGLTNANSGKNAVTPNPVGPSAPEPSDNIEPPYYYQLTEKDFASLTLRQTVLATFAKLEKQQFDQRSQLYNQLSDLFTQLSLPISEQPNIDNLIDSYTIETSQPSTSASTSTSTSTSTVQTTPPEESAGATEDQSTDNKPAATPSPSTQVVETSTQSDIQTNAPQLVWQLNQEELKKTIKELEETALSKEELKSLASLQDEVFPSLYLLQMAMNELAIPLTNQKRQSVSDKAKKSGLSPTHAVPMQWEAPPDCGCQDTVKSIFSVGTFYGFYPYWQHLEKGEFIDFSRLDRIGYIGAVMKREGTSNTLVLPQNWVADPTYSQFIQTTHRYRTMLDLVVTTPRGLTRDQLSGLFTDDMVKRLVASVTAPMDKYFINNVQQWISLGFEGVLPMADGITFDIDLSVLNTQESQQAFLSFLQQLKVALRQSYRHQADINALNSPATDGDRFYVNVIIPAKGIVTVTKDNFYNFRNLDAISKQTNLLIVRPGSAENSDEPKNELNQIKQLQQWLSAQKDQAEVQRLFKQLVPVLITEDNRNQAQELTQLVNLSSWSFLGAAYWPLPLSATNEKLIDNTFFQQAPQYPKPINQVINSINSLLNWVCVNRWEVRAGLFVSFVFILVFLAACIWCFPLRKHLSGIPFVALTSLSISGLMLVFVADPLFEDYKIPILLVTALVIGWILFVVRMVRKEEDKP